ncbi:Detected protein of unknown function [Hibiscus syriacus]|uniref:Fe2OG dioxygenase domain-containing protein n=1 Tax=Hibiscus syriacus TaxID=106335 RepID=A0A6A2YY29_HIBSY|nr:Detected protein of unknown function [Hibiscus syriacus]
MANTRSSACKIPVIDIFDENSKPGTSAWISKCKDVRAAFEQYGCFLATYDKVSSQLQDDVFWSLQQLFNLPTQVKVQNTSDKPYFGYFKHPCIPLSESTGIDNPTILEGTQSFTNLMWPKNNKTFCYGVGKYYGSHIKATDYLLRLINYRVPHEDERDIDACPDHTDKSFMTILHDNEVVGLQVKTKEGDWIGVEPSGSMFLVMAGDAFLAWSNGRIHSPIHRVIATEAGKERYSLAFFSFSGEIIQTPKELVDEAHPQLFKPFHNMDLLRLYSLDDVQKYVDFISQAKCGA